MNKTTLLKIGLVIIIGINNFAISQTINNIKSTSLFTSSVGMISNLVTDKDGHTIVIGSFSDTLVVGNTVKKRIISNGLTDVFIAKFDGFGECEWIYNFGAEKEDIGTAIDLDAEGNVFIAGYFKSKSISFGELKNNVILYNKGKIDGFYIKIDNNGNCIWAKSIGGIGNDYVTELKIDNKQDVLITGTFNEKVIFDQEIKASEIKCKGLDNGYILKIDKDGFWKWSFGISNLVLENIFNIDDIGIDKSNNILIVGFYRGIVDFDPSEYDESFQSTGTYLAKYSENGEFIFTKKVQSAFENFCFDNTIACDSKDNIYIGGNYYTPKKATSKRSIKESVFVNYIEKFNSLGDLVWFKSPILNNGISMVNKISVDKSDYIYFTGFMIESIELSKNMTKTLFDNQQIDICIIKVDTLGLESNTIKIQSSGNYVGTGFYLNKQGNLIITGINDDVVSINNIQFNGRGVFITELDFIDKKSVSNYFEVSPNPNDGKILNLKLDKSVIMNSTIDVNDLSGKKVQFKLITGDSNLKHSLVFSEKLFSGVYTITIKNNNKMYYSKFIVN